MSQIDCRIEQSTGRITLRRPEALNALTHEMCERLEVALMAWKNDEKVSQVIIDAEGEKAFVRVVILQNFTTKGGLATLQMFRPSGVKNTG